MRFPKWMVSTKPLRTPRSSKPINPRCLFPNVPSGPKTSDESRGISGLWMLFFGGVHIGVRSQKNQPILFIFNYNGSLGGNHFE
jgi:hypothetical protein